MKIIFIDIDGVLNSGLGRGPYISDMEIEKLKLLEKLIKESESSGIVITSDRRCSKVDLNNKVEAFNKYHINVLGITRHPSEEDEDDNRGKQILDYLSSSHTDIDRIVILDDNDEGISNYFDEEFVLVNRLYGLNNEIYDKALKILNP